MQQRARSAHTPSPHSEHLELDEPFRQQERAFAGWLADSADIALIRSSSVDCSFAHLVAAAADSPIVMHSLNAAYGQERKRRGSFIATRAGEKQRARTVTTAEYSSDVAGVEHDSEASALWRVEASKAATPLIRGEERSGCCYDEVVIIAP